MSEQNNFDELLAALTQVQTDQSLLAKSVNAAPAAAAAPGTTDDQAIAAAAAAGTPAVNPEDAAEEALAKSVAALNEAAAAAGMTVISGEDLVKSMEALDGRVAINEGVLAKGLQAAVTLLQGQGELMKSMQAQINELSGQGRGRKTLLTVAERPPLGEPLTKSEGAVTVAEVLAKANTAFDAKKISGLEFTALDVALRNGQPPSEQTLHKILS